jgi:hypothetical protein
LHADDVPASSIAVANVRRIVKRRGNMAISNG